MRQRMERLERRVSRIAVTVSVVIGLGIFAGLDLAFGEWGLAIATVGTLAFGFFAVRHLIDR